MGWIHTMHKAKVCGSQLSHLAAFGRNVPLELLNLEANGSFVQASPEFKTGTLWRESMRFPQLLMICDSRACLGLNADLDGLAPCYNTTPLPSHMRTPPPPRFHTPPEIISQLWREKRERLNACENTLIVVIGKETTACVGQDYLYFRAPLI